MSEATRDTQRAAIISNKEAEAIARLWDIGTMAVHQEAERMEATLGRDVQSCTSGASC